MRSTSSSITSLASQYTPANRVVYTLHAVDETGRDLERRVPNPDSHGPFVGVDARDLDTGYQTRELRERSWPRAPDVDLGEDVTAAAYGSGAPARRSGHHLDVRQLLERQLFERVGLRLVGGADSRCARAKGGQNRIFAIRTPLFSP
jgi:hypothetical protein